MDTVLGIPSPVNSDDVHLYAKTAKRSCHPRLKFVVRFSCSV